MSRIDESIEKMNNYIDSIKTNALAKWKESDDTTKAQIEEIAKKTVDTINNSIEKLNKIKESVEENEELNDFLNKIEEKCNDVTEFTINKINNIKPIVNKNLSFLKKDLENDFRKTKSDINSTVNKYKVKVNDTSKKLAGNEHIKNISNLLNELKDKAVKFYNDPKTQEFINEAKLKTIELAEKGLDKLKVILDREDK